MRLEPHIGLYRRNGGDDQAHAPEIGGARLEADAPFGHWRTQTFIAGLRVDELTRSACGPMNRAAFDVYIETQLAPTLQPGDVVIADNLSTQVRMGAGVLKAQGNWMLILPPYSPDLNPIEMAGSPSSKPTCEGWPPEHLMP